MKYEQCKRGIVALCDSFSTFASKREIFRERELMSHGFARLAGSANKAKSIEKLASTIEKHISKDYRNVIGLLHLL